ncbi:MAG: DMT family transporter, partial [Octadecabacter sp.]|nr:DMT family transporter [Octadecabacter sp.]
GGGGALTRARVPIVLAVALLGAVIPNSASYQAAFYLPAGIMAIIIATVPMFAFPIALALGADRFSLRRFAGLVLGLAGVALIALPEASLPERAMIAFVPLALVAPFCYGVEGNVVAKWGTAGLAPVQVLFWACVTGIFITLPLAMATGQFIPPPAMVSREGLAFGASALLHVCVYSSYIWLLGRAGAVFAGQVAYLVTGFGVLWSMLLLGEVYSLFVWLALLVMFAGLTLVRPRDQSPLAPPAVAGETA